MLCVRHILCCRLPQRNRTASHVQYCDMRAYCSHNALCNVTLVCDVLCCVFFICRAVKTRHYMEPVLEVPPLNSQIYSHFTLSIENPILEYLEISEPTFRNLYLWRRETSRRFATCNRFSKSRQTPTI